MDYIDPTLAKGFHTNYPDFGKACPRAALTQRTLLTDMLSALIKTENNVSNVLKIVSSAHGGEQSHMVPSPGGPLQPSQVLPRRLLYVMVAAAMNQPRVVRPPRVALLSTGVLDATAHTHGLRRRIEPMWFASPMQISLAFANRPRLRSKIFS
jgi:hypothetical protein